MSSEQIRIVLKALWAIGITGEQAESAGRIVGIAVDQAHERCARIAETYLDAENGTPEGCDIARLIRESR